MGKGNKKAKGKTIVDKYFLSLIGLILIIGLIVGLSASLFFQLRTSKNRINTLKQEKNSLEENKSELKDKYNLLVEEKSQLEDKYNSTQQDLDQLQSEHNELQSNYNELQSNYSKLQNKYINMSHKLGQSVKPPYIVVEGRNFTVGYKNLEGEVETWWWTGYLEDQVYSGTLAREFSYSEMEYLGMDWLTDRFEDNTKYRTLEEGGTVYQYKPFVKTEGLDNLAEDIYDKYSLDFNSDEKRIKAVHNFVTQLSDYTKDPEGLEETPRFPFETLLMGGGDCEDSAILTASILKAMPEEWEIKLITMDSENPSNVQSVDHMIVWVDTGEYSTFIETTNPETMNPYTEVEGYWEDVSG